MHLFTWRQDTNKRKQGEAGGVSQSIIQIAGRACNMSGRARWPKPLCSWWSFFLERGTAGLYIFEKRKNVRFETYLYTSIPIYVRSRNNPWRRYTRGDLTVLVVWLTVSRNLFLSLLSAHVLAHKRTEYYLFHKTQILQLGSEAFKRVLSTTRLTMRYYIWGGKTC